MNSSPATEVSMEDYENSSTAAPEPVKAEEFKLSGDSVPEEFRGKSAADVLNAVKDMQSKLSVAESARVAAEAMAKVSNQAPPAAAIPVDNGPKDLTEEEIKAIYDEDPIKAIQVINEQAIRQAERHMEARLAPLQEGSRGAAESWARTAFPEEFALFGDQIQTLIQNVPNKAAFSSQKAWEDAVSFVRGQSANFDKLVNHRSAMNTAKARDEARNDQRNSAGFSGVAGGQGPSGAISATTLSEEQRQACRSMIRDGIISSEAEYVKYANM